MARVLYCEYCTGIPYWDWGIRTVLGAGELGIPGLGNYYSPGNSGIRHSGTANIVLGTQYWDWGIRIVLGAEELGIPGLGNYYSPGISGIQHSGTANNGPWNSFLERGKLRPFFPCGLRVF